MNIGSLAIKEISCRKGRFAAGIVSVILATATLVGAFLLLRSYDARTREILRLKQDELQKQLDQADEEMRKAMLRLGFNVVILPEGQNLGDFYADDYAAADMPEEFVHRLAASRVVTVQHLLPSLQQKIVWPETRRTVILIGTRGEVPITHADPKKPMQDQVPEGKIVVGHELHQSLGLKVGDKVTLLGREFQVQACHAERGNKDDITLWINLKTAQELLGKQGRINAILALECRCAWADLAKVRAEIGKILPGTKVIEFSSNALARAEARYTQEAAGKAAIANEAKARQDLRRERERLAAVLVPVVLAACGLWIGLLVFGDVRERRGEIGILRAIGLRSRQIMLLFLAKAMVMGAGGGVAGMFLGVRLGRDFGSALDQAAATLPVQVALTIPEIAIVLLAAPLLSMLAAWIPATIAAQQDPAEILREI